MNLSLAIDLEHFHHAYLLEGDQAQLRSDLLQFLADAGVSVTGNPNLSLVESDVFRIDDAHELRRAQLMRSEEGERKIFIVSFNTMISEAQNALLKTLEEPTPGTHFFFLTRTRALLIPTVLSRMFVIDASTENDTSLFKQGKVFLDAPIPERLKLVERIVKQKADDKERAKVEGRALLDAIELALGSRVSDPGCAVALQDVRTAKRYSMDRSPSMKLLLEHLALTLPLP